MRFVLVGALLLALAGSAQAAVFSFRTPSKNIGCIFSSEPVQVGGGLRCDILSGLRPTPQRVCGLDLTGFELHPAGRASVVCAGDTAVNPRAKAVPYGAKWARGGFTCLSRRSGLRCHNRSGHGFFLSRKHSYRF